MFAFNRESGESAGAASNFQKVGVKLDKTTGEFVGVEQMLDMVERSGSQVGRTSTQAAMSNLARSRKDT